MCRILGEDFLAPELKREACFPMAVSPSVGGNPARLEKSELWWEASRWSGEEGAACMTTPGRAPLPCPCPATV